MYYPRALRVVISIICLSFFSSLAVADESADAAAVIERFNAAITDRDVDAIVAELADGSVQFQLRAVHPGMSDNPPLTADLQATWKTVAAILFPMSEVYERKSTVDEAKALGEVATVWTTTKTRTLRKGNAEPMNLEFTEVYLLVKKSGQWKIAGIADNRAPDNIPVTPES